MRQIMSAGSAAVQSASAADQHRDQIAYENAERIFRINVRN
jgi:hypothetical protein